MQRLSPDRRRRRVLPLLAGVSAAVLTLAGCSTQYGEASRGWLPYGATTGADRVSELWVGMWIAAWIVGGLVWGLTIYCMIKFRRKKDDVGLPPQLRYNVPIEVLYTVIPVMMVGVIFYFTHRDEAYLLDTSEDPSVTVNVVGKQWSWDFNYIDAGVWDSGVQAQLTGKPGVEETLPTLVLPVNERIEFVLTARDVIHSFWVPAFQQKLDMVPGKVNKFQVTTTTEGNYVGKCAELCGAYHAAMLFNVKIVSRAEYDQHMNELRAAGQTGMLDNSLSRQPLEPGQQQYLPTPQAGVN
nr:cytochrome c oxidase subunit II [Kineosphaera limosa]